jgi:hypothetical protein
MMHVFAPSYLSFSGEPGWRRVFPVVPSLADKVARGQKAAAKWQMAARACAAVRAGNLSDI